jgi:hypothetical protein
MHVIKSLLRKSALNMFSRPMEDITPVTAFCGEGSNGKNARLVSLSLVSDKCKANETIIHHQEIYCRISRNIIEIRPGAKSY